MLPFENGGLHDGDWRSDGFRCSIACDAKAAIMLQSFDNSASGGYIGAKDRRMLLVSTRYE